MFGVGVDPFRPNPDTHSPQLCAVENDGYAYVVTYRADIDRVDVFRGETVRGPWTWFGYGVLRDHYVSSSGMLPFFVHEKARRLRDALA